MKITQFLLLGLVTVSATSPAAVMADEAIESPQPVVISPEFDDEDAPQVLHGLELDDKSSRRSTSQITTPTINEQIVRIATEEIQHRYPDGATSISRQVYRNEAGEFVDHGFWKLWDPHGNLVAEGQCEHGIRAGTWIRTHQRTDAPLFSTLPFSGFEGPFLSQATFKNGKLDGDWTIQDAKQFQIVKWHYENGIRQGEQTWFYRNGQKMRTIVYTEGTIHGDAILWNTDGNLIQQDTYLHGRRQVVEQTYFDDSDRPKSQITILQPSLVKATEDDWWNASPADFVATGEPVKHGPFATWHRNGQRAIKGQYNFNEADGEFVWWYDNGQQAIQGAFSSNRSEGRWFWWHQNGQRAIEGTYHNGTPTGQWSQWNPDGRIVQRGQVSIDAPVIANQAAAKAAPASNRY